MKFIRSRALLQRRNRRTTHGEEPVVPPEPVDGAIVHHAHSGVPSSTVTTTMTTTNTTMNATNASTSRRRSSSRRSTGNPLLPPVHPETKDVTPPQASRECVSPDSVACFPSQTLDVPPPLKRPVTLHSPKRTCGAPFRQETLQEIQPDVSLLPTSPIPTLPIGRPLESTLNHGEPPNDETTRPKLPPKGIIVVPKRVSFADKDGAPLQHIRVIERAPTRKLLLLLLSPQDRKFEFLNLEYPLDDHTTAKVVVDQIPKLASNPLFRTLTFTSLARTSVSEQLDGDGLMAEFDLKDNELLLGVPMGYQAHQIGAFAVPLLLNGDIIKAVKAAKRSGKGLKVIQSGNEWKRRGRSSRTIPKSSTKCKLRMLSMEDDDNVVVEPPPTEVTRDNNVVSESDGSGGDDLNFTRTSRSVEQLSVSFTASTADATTTTKQTTDTIHYSSSPPRMADTTSTSPGPETTTIATTFFQPRTDDALQASFSDCKAELSRLAALEPRPIPQVKSISRPGSYEELHSLETNARSVVDQLIRRASADEDEEKGDEDATACLLQDIPSFEEGSYYSFDDDEMPDMDKDGDAAETLVPDLVQNILGVGADKVVLLLHAVSIAAVGYFANLLT
jgi:hypothetical protein